MEFSLLNCSIKDQVHHYNWHINSKLLKTNPLVLDYDFSIALKFILKKIIFACINFYHENIKEKIEIENIFNLSKKIFKIIIHCLVIKKTNFLKEINIIN